MFIEHSNALNLDKNFNDYLDRIYKKYIIPSTFEFPSHYFYQDKSDDINFHPLEIIKELKKLIK